MRYLSSRFFGVLALLLMGCGEDETIVARVGEVEIEQAEFAAFVRAPAAGIAQLQGWTSSRSGALAVDD